MADPERKNPLSIRFPYLWAWMLRGPELRDIIADPSGLPIDGRIARVLARRALLTHEARSEFEDVRGWETMCDRIEGFRFGILLTLEARRAQPKVSMLREHFAENAEALTRSAQALRELLAPEMLRIDALASMRNALKDGRNADPYALVHLDMLTPERIGSLADDVEHFASMFGLLSRAVREAPRGRGRPSESALILGATPWIRSLCDQHEVRDPARRLAVWRAFASVELSDSALRKVAKKAVLR